MASCCCTSPRCASGELRDLLFTINKRGQGRRSGSLMNCMLKQIHILPVAWLYTGTWFFNGGGKQTFWQDRILLRAICVLLSLKSLGRICSWIEKTQPCWGMIELSLILRCSWRQVFHAVSVRAEKGALWDASYEILLLPCACSSSEHENLKKNILVL